jgi:hypothetical protein
MLQRQKRAMNEGIIGDKVLLCNNERRDCSIFSANMTEIERLDNATIINYGVIEFQCDVADTSYVEVSILCVRTMCR